MPTAPCVRLADLVADELVFDDDLGPAPPPMISNLIKVGKLKLNKEAGTATLTVNPRRRHPDHRRQGVKKVVRSSKGAATLHLPIKPVGKAKEASPRPARPSWP